MKTYYGNGCAEGVSFGKALLKIKYVPQVDLRTVQDVDAEIALLGTALEVMEHQVNQLYDCTLEESGEEAAELIEPYQMILYDNTLFDAVREEIRQHRAGCARAIQTVCRAYADKFSRMDDAYMRDRYMDIQEICRGLMQYCETGSVSFQSQQLQEPTIIVADTLTPMDTVRLDKSLLRGFVMESGGATSHAVILAKTLGIPAIVGMQNITKEICDGEEIAMSGDSGKLVVSPDDTTRATFRTLYARQQAEKESYAKEPLGEVFTTDGKRILLAVNISGTTPEDLPCVEACDGVGLFRTEFLYMQHSNYPDEDTQAAAYTTILQHMQGKDVIIRTLDIGGDKSLDYMDLPTEDNPFMGFRAVRVCLSRPEVFKTQLRALLRASVHGNLKIMFPMITCYEELRRSRELLETCKAELRSEGVPFSEDVPIGIMVETPASVLILDQLAPDIDFISVGSNDLVQYTMAADRGNSYVKQLYSPYHIAILRSLRTIGKVAKENHLMVGVCGEIASASKLIPFLVGCGVDELSVVASSLPKVRYILRHADTSICAQLVETVCGQKTAEASEIILDQFLQQTVLLD